MRIPLPLGGKPEAEGQKSLIDRNGRLTQQLREPAGGGPAIQLHLPEAVARLQIADRPPGVPFGSGKDMRHGEPVEPHFDRPEQTRKGDASV